MRSWPAILLSRVIKNKIADKVYYSRQICEAERRMSLTVCHREWVAEKPEP